MLSVKETNRYQSKIRGVKVTTRLMSNPNNVVKLSPNKEVFNPKA